MADKVQNNLHQLHQADTTSALDLEPVKELTKCSNDVTEEIINELDDLFINNLQLMDAYTKSVIQEEKLFKDGLINIAHSRLCMIPNMISTHGLKDNEDFPPTSTVISNGDDYQCHHAMRVDTTMDRELLGLFGKNISSSLKKAQIDFQHVLENVVDRANILRKMDDVNRRNSELIANYLN